MNEIYSKIRDSRYTDNSLEQFNKQPLHASTLCSLYYDSDM